MSPDGLERLPLSLQVGHPHHKHATLMFVYGAPVQLPHKKNTLDQSVLGIFILRGLEREPPRQGGELRPYEAASDRAKANV